VPDDRASDPHLAAPFAPAAASAPLRAAGVRGRPALARPDPRRERLAEVLAAAGLPLVGLEPLRSGGGVWRVRGAAGAWVVRLAPADARGALAATMLWAEALSAAGLPVPRPWRPVGAAEPALVEVDDGFALVTSWTLGTAVAERGWDEASAVAMGRLLAATHVAAEALPPRATEGARRYDAAWAGGAWDRLEIGRALPEVPAEEAALVQGALAHAGSVLAAAWLGGDGGPVVLAHADVHAENVLEVARQEEVVLALIDLDRVGLAPAALDLTFALLDHVDATAWACLRGYAEVRALDPGFERVYAAFRLLATVDNLGFLAAFEQERPFVAAAWPDLVASSAALTAPRVHRRVVPRR
jgi:hypothetical protein